MNLRQAAEMALEVFEKIYEGCGEVKKDNLSKQSNELATLVRKDCIPQIKALRQALAQPEEEPVAWFIQYEDSHEFVWSKPDGWRVKQALEIQPLYTAPPISDYHEGWEEGFKAGKREWVGLTHEERFLNDCRSPEEIEYAIAIEAKLKEKNT